jgi:transposase InsO family protein
MILALVEQATQRGASRAAIGDVLGLSRRTLERWRTTPDGEDGRQGPLTTPPHALTREERAEIVSIATSAEYRNLSVRQVVPRLADKGRYVASESSFYRVLEQEGLAAHRGHVRPRTGSRGPRTHKATGPGQVWSWDITYLRSPVRGAYFYLYLVLDIWSRKVVGYAVHEVECTGRAAALIEAACASENISRGDLVLHSDNGVPMKGATMLATLQRLGVASSFSRPSVSDDNAICEAIFRTLKYRPGYPRRPFATRDAARVWVDDFVAWYNTEHLHSALRYVTPKDRHDGRDANILARRRAVYAHARKRAPRRWSKEIRNWTPIGDVILNPIREATAA